jgi:hypothetical protein
MSPKRRRTKPELTQSDRIVELSDFEAVYAYAQSQGVPADTLVQKIAKLEQRQDVGVSNPLSPSRDKPKDQVQAEQNDTDEDLTSLGKAVFAFMDFSMYLVPLLSVHFILNYLVRVQYGQNPEPLKLVPETLQTIPVISILHWSMHSYRTNVWFKLSAAVASTLIGGYILYASYEEAYYAVMQRIPPLGTIWIWIFFELAWEYAVISLLILGAYMWKNQYGFW